MPLWHKQTAAQPVAIAPPCSLDDFHSRQMENLCKSSKNRKGDNTHKAHLREICTFHAYSDGPGVKERIWRTCVEALGTMIQIMFSATDQSLAQEAAPAVKWSWLTKFGVEDGETGASYLNFHGLKVTPQMHKRIRELVPFLIHPHSVTQKDSKSADMQKSGDGNLCVLDWRHG